jgi:tetratricopeptide (TPR) repeat protein
MKIEVTPTSISASIAPAEPDPKLEADGRVFYVYVHKDKAGNVFYVGKGRDRRAWSTQRHPVWRHYVETRLHQEYDVEIVRSDLLNSEAEALEAELVNDYGEHLVNWNSTARGIDCEACDRYWESRQATDILIAETWPIERTDPERAIGRYREALTRMYEYECIETEHGLVGELVREMGVAGGNNTLLDRLTLCLCRLGRAEEAAAETDRYLTQFPARRSETIPVNVLRRIERARHQTRTGRCPTSVPVPNCSSPEPCLSVSRDTVTSRQEEMGEVPVSVDDEARASGRYNGRHFTEYLPDIYVLKEERQYGELERLLLALLDAVEAQARADGFGITPAYYKELAVLYRRTGRYVDEVRVLERFATQKRGPGAMVAELITRLHKARGLANTAD